MIRQIKRVLQSYHLCREIQEFICLGHLWALAEIFGKTNRCHSDRILELLSEELYRFRRNIAASSNVRQCFPWDLKNCRAFSLNINGIASRLPTPERPHSPYIVSQCSSVFSRSSPYWRLNLNLSSCSALKNVPTAVIITAPGVSRCQMSLLACTILYECGLVVRRSYDGLFSCLSFRSQ